MSLKEKIDAYKEGFRKRAPKEAQEIMRRATEALENSPQMLSTIKVGDVAPDFTLENGQHQEVALADLLDNGPVVLGFYRGRW